ncbi:MAG: hypothetical protein WKH47_09475 [Actinomycetes bacterium]
MHLDEARARKAELLDEARSVRIAAADPGDGSGGIYVGIVPSDRPDGYRIAIRLTGDGPDEPADRIEVARTTGGADADVRYVGRVRALASEVRSPGVSRADEPTATELQQRVRPLVRGSSVAHVEVSAGTIGAFVRIAGASAVHVLSNNHVLAATDLGRSGDEVLQPGPADGGTGADRIGALAAAVPLDPDGPNLVDAAVAVVDDEVPVDPTAHDGPVTETVDPDAVRGLVRKIGRTTGVTRGRISAFEVDGVPVGYGTGVFSFDDQIEIEGVLGLFSDGGDSGSLITTEGDRLGVGLLFAGSATGGPGGTGVTYANPLAAVLRALDATLDGGPGEVPDPL